MNRLPTGAALFFFHEYNDARPYFIRFGEYFWRLTEKERKLLEIIEKAGELTIRELKDKSGYGWSTLYNTLKTLTNKEIITISPESGRRKKVVLKKEWRQGLI